MAVSLSHLPRWVAASVSTHGFWAHSEPADCLRRSNRYHCGGWQRTFKRLRLEWELDAKRSPEDVPPYEFRSLDAAGGGAAQALTAAHQSPMRSSTELVSASQIASCPSHLVAI